MYEIKSPPQEMINRVLLNGFLASLIQLILYVGLVYPSWFIGSQLFEPRGSINDYPLHLALVFFGSILIIQNVLGAIIHKTWFHILLFALACLVYVFIFIEDLRSFPFSTIVFLLSGLLPLALKFYIDNSRIKNSE